LPTPLWRGDRLDALVGAEVWVKRDDMNGGPEAGNKIRKLEYLLADALDQGATAVITCGALQSNHARATAILARRLGLRPVLLLRTPDGTASGAARGNAFLDALVDAEVRTITPEQYRERDHHMREVADELGRAGERAYVIPEGGSNALGSLGYVDAMQETRAQLDSREAGAPTEFDAVAHACGSGGTAAGVAVGARRFGIARRTLAMAVCDDRAYFEAAVARILDDGRAWFGASAETNDLRVIDEYKGPAYGVATDAQKRFVVEVARATGLVLDPVYTGKALFALARMPDKPKRVLFLHTGGLPGLFAQADDLADALRPDRS
jgi:D-cysteine desulfhydrase